MSALRPTRRYHFHTPGVLYVLVTLFLAVGAVNSQNNLLFAALGLAIGGLLVSGVLSGASLLGVTVSRERTLSAAVGRPLSITYALGNSNRVFPSFGLNICEWRSASSGARANWPARVPEPRAFAAHIGPRRSVTAAATVIPFRRGRVELTAVRIWSTFPFGLARKSVTFDVAQSFIVHPLELRLRAGLVSRLTSRAPMGRGAERNPGAGDEIYGIREYTPGDSPKRIAWRRSARTGEVVVRQNSAPAPLKIWVLLRLDPDPAARAEPITTERAVALAAALVRELLEADVSVGLAVASPRVVIPPSSGRRHAERLLNELAVVEPAPTDEPAPIPAPVVRGGACVVVHAAAIRPGLGPRGATHLSAHELESHVAPAAASSLHLLDPISGDSAEGRERWTRVLVRRAVHAIGGSA